MKDFRLALVAHDSVLNQKGKNLARTAHWVAQAAKARAHLVLLPELSVTGHGGDPSMIRDAEEVPAGPSITRLIALAKEHNLYISAGIAELENGAAYNTQVIVGPDGFAGKQRKLHLSRDEYFFFRHGSTLPVFDLPFARVGMVICFDNEITETHRTLAVQGAEVILAPHAWRSGPWTTSAAKRQATKKGILDHMTMVHRCRANDSGVFVGVCNATGRAAHGTKGVQKGVESNHLGGCLCVGPNGKVLGISKAKDMQEEMLVTDLKAAQIQERREMSCFSLRVRRVEAFGPLTARTA